MSSWESERTPEEWHENYLASIEPNDDRTIYLGDVCQSCSQFWETAYRNAGAKSFNYTLVEPLECSECEGEE